MIATGWSCPLRDSTTTGSQDDNERKVTRPVNTNADRLRAGESHQQSLRSSKICYPNNGVTFRYPIYNCSTPFCMSRNRAANGAGYRRNSAIGHTIYTPANRWAKQGVLDDVFAALQENDIINSQGDHVSLDSTAVKVHPDGTGALKKRSTIDW
jgi:hypothetical protein